LVIGSLQDKPNVSIATLTNEWNGSNVSF